ncbi:hypothetical protein [Herbaspirillum huttiense]|uniref:Uncharacterized protein n=1 Tax=Herbaspirillum huttiense subsp. lycopersici TaxID=3074428 RepID=A0ABU2EGR3_9BURK|nr:hypothetical protein [Herbaspirillum huttiense]MDR9847070.1 hypothetical protein [Herbaspirillum huttiense SE1]
MIDKLKALPIEKLLELQDALKSVIEQKRRGFVRPGATVIFDNKMGEPTQLFIQRVNPKSVTGYEVAPDGKHLPNKIWRVSPGLLRPKTMGDTPKTAGGTW